MFGRKKSAITLSVVAVANKNRVGVLEVVRGGRFRAGDILRITDIYPLRDGGEEMKVEILKDGRVHSAGTLQVRNGTFEAHRRLQVEKVEVMPTS